MATAFNMRSSDMEERSDPLSDAAIQDKVAALVQELQALADEQVRRKQEVEQRWLENLRQFHGRYEPDTEQSLKDAKKSRAFVKITRKKTNSWEARMSALLFPTDEENWDIRPTPVPTLHEAAKQATAAAQQQVEQANQMAQQDPQAAEQMAQQAQGALDEASMAQQLMAEANKRAAAMRKEMRDQLVECDYAAQARLVIRDGVRMGSGILKGPLVGDQTRGKWVAIDGEYTYERESDPAPKYRWVNPWSYFPDMSAIRPEDREFEFERHLWSAQDLRKLVRDKGFSKTAVRELLEDKPKDRPITETGLNYLTELRAITGSNDTVKNRYIGWEYHGPLACDQIAAVLRALGNEAAALQYEEDPDPLKEVRVICYFCEGKLLKMSPAYPLDSQESLYSIFTFEESEASMFGYGIPQIMADSQKAMNGAWRMALDNAALSVGPQIFIDKDAITPADGQWELAPRKIWYKRKGMVLGDSKIFDQITITNNVNEIMNIVETARRFIDDETALPVQAEGELTDNPNITATATNFMSMAANITFRRVVKNFDDNITVPSIRRLYDWNMQHNSREDIKGDMKVEARGSSHLLQRELQAQMLLNVAQNWSQHPLLGMAIKPYDAISEALRGAMIQPETIMVSREEFEAAQQQAAQQAAEQPPDASVVAAQARLEAAKVDAASRKEVAQMNRETELLKLAQNYDLSIERLRTMLGMKEMEIDHKERVVAVEAAMEERLAKEARRAGKEAKGSGGYVSA